MIAEQAREEVVDAECLELNQKYFSGQGETPYVDR